MAARLQAATSSGKPVLLLVDYQRAVALSPAAKIRSAEELSMGRNDGV
jgi:hypothetical protein